MITSIKKLFAHLFSFYLDKITYPRFEHFDKHYASYQKDYQRFLYQQFSRTAIGHSLGMNKWNAKKLQQHWKRDLPIITGSDYQKKWIPQSMKKKNILWPGKITAFSKSSWTTSKGKRIPFTRDTKKTNIRNGLYLQSMIHRKRQKPTIFAGKHHSLGWTIQKVDKKNNYIGGDVSALLTQSANFLLASLLYAYPKQTLLQPWSQKSVLYENTLPQKNISLLYGVTKWEEMLLKRIIALHGQQGSTSIKEVLPSLEVVVWWGVSIQPFLSSFLAMWLSLEENLVGVYNASEGIFGFQAWTDHNGGIHQQQTQYRPTQWFFAEFIPVEYYDSEWNIPKKHYDKIVDYSDLCQHPDQWLNKKVGLIVSVPWLLRCPMDIIQITCVQPLRYTLLWRPASINMTGEEVSEHQVMSAIARLDTAITLFSVTWNTGKDSDGIQRLEWIVEVPHAICDNTAKQTNIRQQIDLYLQELNDDYKTKRSTQNSVGEFWLGEPIVHFVAPGTFTAYAKATNRLGGQYKIPKATSQRTFVEWMLTWLKEKE